MKESKINNQTVYFLGNIQLPNEKPVSEPVKAAFSPVRGRLYKPINLPVARFMGEAYIRRELVYEMRHHDTHFIIHPRDLKLASIKEVDNYLVGV